MKPAEKLRLVASTPMLPHESAREHLANAIQTLIGHEATHQAVWEFSPELRSVEALLFKALYELDRTP